MCWWGFEVIWSSDENGVNELCLLDHQKAELEVCWCLNHHFQWWQFCLNFWMKTMMYEDQKTECRFCPQGALEVAS